MFRRYRQRRGPYALAEPAGVPPVFKSLLLLLLVLVAVWYVGGWVFRLIGGGNELQRKPVTLTVQGRGVVNVSIDGGLLKRTEDAVPLYSNDQVTTGDGGHALLSFFEDSRGRLDEHTELLIQESALGSEESTIELVLKHGGLWMYTSARAFSGSLVRSIETPLFSVDAPLSAEFIVTPNALLVFSAEGLGLSVSVKGVAQPLTIGEGQRFVLPKDANLSGNLYSYRTALDPSSFNDTFARESRMTSSGGQGSAEGNKSGGSAELLTVLTPEEGATIMTSTTLVQGRFGKGVEKVRVNGYQASVDTTLGTFSQEISLEGESLLELRIQALGANDRLLAQVQRTVNHMQAVSTVPSPTITNPAKEGSVYRTQQQELVLRGGVPPKTAGVMVNDYALQLFNPQKGAWSYLASTKLGNLKSGANTYDVYALDGAGHKSEPVRITILLEEGTEGVVKPTEGSNAASAPTVIDETTLPQNTPLSPGTLAVTGPTAGTSHTATGSEFVLQGTTSASTKSVWVNGYMLQLYKPGKTTWNYIASTELKTLKRGKNTYRIVARNEKNEVLDVLTYTVTYNP